MTKRTDIAFKITQLLSKYGKRTPNGQHWASPDASCMEAFGQMLKDPDVPLKAINAPFSDFHQGGYLNNKSAEFLHEEILKDFDRLLTIECKKCKTPTSARYDYCPHCGTKIE